MTGPQSMNWQANQRVERSLAIRTSSPSFPELCLVAAIADLTLVALIPIFLASAVLVWWTGTRLTGLVDQVARRLGMGQAFAGMVLLGGITSLPELAAVSTSSLSGNATLAVNNLLGSAALNVLLLVFADVVFGRDALTRVAAQPGTLMQGVLGMMLLAAVAGVVLWGDVSLGPVGAGSVVVAVLCLLAMRISSGFERRDVWRRVDDEGDEPNEDADPERSLPRMLVALALLAITILAAGAMLALSAEGIAEQAGLSSGMVGFLLVALATSLPELSSVTAAVRAGRYELAVGDIFGTNLFNLTLLALADLLSSAPEPVLAAAGTFEVLGALVALLMTGAFVVGLLERKDKTVLRMGYDAVAALLIFVGGIAVMAPLAP